MKCDVSVLQQSLALRARVYITSSHIKKYRFILSLQPNIEAVDGFAIPFLPIRDERPPPGFILDRQ